MRASVPIQYQIFGDYVVVSKNTGKSTDGHTTFEVKCMLCDKVEFKIAKDLKAGRSKMCKSCASKLTAKTYPPPVVYKGIGELGSTFFSAIRRGAEKRGLEFNISKQFAWDLIVKQEFRCALSGIPITLTRKTHNSSPAYSLFNASIDRIDSTKGYTESNVQWVHKDINMMKQSYSQEYFIELCKLVTQKGGTCGV